MKEFEPSRDFVARVMRDVHDYEQQKVFPEPLSQRLFASRAFRLAFSSGAALLGLFNLVRLYFMILSPMSCG